MKRKWYATLGWVETEIPVLRMNLEATNAHEARVEAHRKVNQRWSNMQVMSVERMEK